jgi:hypothetical protein
MRTILGQVVQVQARVGSPPGVDGWGCVTAEIIDQEQDWTVRIAHQQVLQAGEEIVGAQPLPEEIHPPSGPDIPRPTPCACDLGARGGMRRGWPTQCHMARIRGRSGTRDSSPDRRVTWGPAALTALAITHCVYALAGSVVSAIASRGRPHRRPRLCSAFRHVLVRSRPPS